MKTFLKTLVLGLCFLVACSKEPLQITNIDSYIERETSYRLSHFTIHKKILDVGDIKDFTINLKSQSTGEILSFTAEAKQEDENYIKVSLKIPSDVFILDGDYILLAKGDESTNICKRILARFKGERMTLASQDATSYSLKGGGLSASDPYLISSQDDFNSFLSSLSGDSNNGYGYYFKQTVDVTFNALSIGSSSPQFVPHAFAGTYMGKSANQQSKITLSFIGAKRSGKDENIGLFSELLSGAVVKDLLFNMNMSNIYKNAGAVAGMASGKVSISNIYVTGSIIDSYDNIGGLIGHAISNSELSIKDCYSTISISARTYVGGAVGYSEGAVEVIGFENLRRDDKNYGMISLSVTESFAGGVLGSIYSSSSSNVTLKNITLKNDISSEDVGINIIHSNHGDYLGGLVGLLYTQGDILIESCHVIAPINGGSDSDLVGGIVGSCSATGSGTFTLKSVRYASGLTGRDYVGGMFGLLRIYSRTLSIPKVDKYNCSVKKENGFCDIKGSSYVGGFAGALYAYTNEKFDLQDSFTIACSISGESYVGGIVGYLDNCDMNTSNFLIDANTDIEGTGSYIGGLFGFVQDVELKGRSTNVSSISWDATSHSKSDMLKSLPNPDFPGWVNKKGGDQTKCVGGIVGSARNSFLSKYSVSGTIYGGDRVGGIVGEYYNERYGGNLYYLTNCYNVSSNPVKCASSEDGARVGGIVAMFHHGEGKMEYLYNYASVESATPFSGGIFGEMTSSNGAIITMSHLFNFGDVSSSSSGKSDVCVGGIASRLSKSISSATLEDSYNGGAIIASSANNRSTVGGIFGYTDNDNTSINCCTNSGLVKITGNSGNCYAGGIIGFTIERTTISESCNTGQVHVDKKGGSNVGGLVGITDYGILIQNCYNSGNVSSDQDDDNGGIIGCVDDGVNVKYTFNIGKVNSGNHIFGTHDDWIDSWSWTRIYGVGTDAKFWKGSKINWDDRRKSEKYSDYDFEKIWRIPSGDSYNNGAPVLRNNAYQFLKYKK